MKNIYIDTSSLVKAYHRESDSDKIINTLSEYQSIFLSELTKIEFISAIWKKVSRGEATEAEARAVVRFFEKDHKKYQWIIIDSEIINSGISLLNKHSKMGLRTLDAIQLACAVSVRNKANKFLTSDKILNAIFLKEGLAVV